MGFALFHASSTQSRKISAFRGMFKSVADHALRATWTLVRPACSGVSPGALRVFMRDDAEWRYGGLLEVVIGEGEGGEWE